MKIIQSIVRIFLLSIVLVNVADLHCFAQNKIRAQSTPTSSVFTRNNMLIAGTVGIGLSIAAVLLYRYRYMTPPVLIKTSNTSAGVAQWRGDKAGAEQEDTYCTL